MTIQEMLELKKEYGLSYAMIAEATMLPLSTLQKVFSGKTQSPRYDTMQRLTEYFEGEKSARQKGVERYTYKPKIAELPEWLREPSAYHVEKKQQGEFTVDDYHLFPEDYRVELIDGVVIEMEGPHYVHQFIAGEVYHQIKSYIKKKGGRCLPGIAPLDVQLDKDNKTIIQPDVFIMCDRDKLVNGRVYGEPDWVMEVLSPSSKSKDCIKKLNKYMEAGVREYWIVDPKERTVTVYDFEHDHLFLSYTFEDQIPVNIFDGDLMLDMTEVQEYADMLLEDE